MHIDNNKYLSENNNTKGYSQFHRITQCRLVTKPYFPTGHLNHLYLGQAANLSNTTVTRINLTPAQPIFIYQIILSRTTLTTQELNRESHNSLDETTIQKAHTVEQESLFANYAPSETYIVKIRHITRIIIRNR